MIKLEEYIKLRELLHASEEDFEVACENIKNLKLSDIVLMMFGTRQAFCEKFNIDYHAIKEWNDMFKDLKKSLHHTERDIVEYEVHEQMVPVFKNTWSFISNVDIKLNWNGHTG